MAIRSNYPHLVETVVRPVGRGVARLGVSANVLTTTGLLLTAAATWSVANGHLMTAGWLLAAGGLMDVLDGSVARANNRATPFGGFYDSVTDRVSDGLILGGMAWWVSDQPRLFVLTIVALVAAEVTSYVRARAEAIDLTCTIGILERAERAVLLIVGLLLHQWLLEPVLWILAVGGTVTVVQRVHHVWCQIDRDIPEELLALAMADAPWSRAFKGAARRFYGERNFADAVDGRGEPTIDLGADPAVGPPGEGRAPRSGGAPRDHRRQQADGDRESRSSTSPNDDAAGRARGTGPAPPEPGPGPAQTGDDGTATPDGSSPATGSGAHGGTDGVRGRRGRP